jgi:hypothetical protein
MKGDCTNGLYLITVTVILVVVMKYMDNSMEQSPS